VSNSARRLGPVCVFLDASVAVGYVLLFVRYSRGEFHTHSLKLHLSYWRPLFWLFATATAFRACKQVPVPPALAVSDLAILVFVSTIRSEEEYAINRWMV
jgi:hypothetical protein